jgi:hypothetical protein
VPTIDPASRPTGPDEDDSTGAPSIDPASRPTGPDEDDSTISPSMAPSMCEDREVEVALVPDGPCVVEGEPIALVSRTDEVAVLSLSQTWNSPNVDWIAAVFKTSGEEVCVDDANVDFAATAATPFTYTVDCSHGDWASLELYVKHDNFNTGFMEVSTACADSAFVVSTENICKYTATVPCRCAPGGERPTGPDEDDETSAPSPFDATRPTGPDVRTPIELLSFPKRTGVLLFLAVTSHSRLGRMTSVCNSESTPSFVTRF